MGVILELDGVGKAYDGKPALAGLSVAVEEGEYISLLGPSGSGKSTMLRVIAGFERPDYGDVRVKGRSMLGVPAHERGIGFVFQNFALFPHMTVFDNVAFGLKYRQDRQAIDAADVTNRVNAMLELVGLSGLGARAIGQISGGQKQRVALARTLVADPKLTLLDEPLGALDANLRERMMVELRRIHRQLGMTFIHVTGNEQEALAMGDRVIVLDQGKLVQLAPPDTIYNRPSSPRVARFLNCYNMFEGRIEAGRFRRGAIDFPSPKGAASSAAKASYCIRIDKISVGKRGEGGAGLHARYVASEYDGPTITYIFTHAEGGSLEVEYHLSHREPEEFDVDRLYELSWPADEALLYPLEGGA
ncbi:MAG TPA: ABC transporter ATP-binding protein [Stellaceae bacterium]|nr:ABC transporter ATP-binding protein [Stellaceae bacterium]